MGVHTDFHFSLSAYVKMLSLSPSQVLPLQMPELSVRNRLRVRGRKSGKISILNKHNFVTLSSDYHGSPFAMFPNFLSPFCFFASAASASSFSRTLKGNVSALNYSANVTNSISQPFEMERCLIVLLPPNNRGNIGRWLSRARRCRCAYVILGVISSTLIDDKISIVP